MSDLGGWAPDRKVVYPSTTRCASGPPPPPGEDVRGSHRSLELVDQVGLLPREEVALGVAAEMAVAGGLLVDRLVELEMLANALGRQAHQLGQHFFQLGLGDGAGAVRVDIDRQRLGDADRVAELDRAARREARGDDVLGEVARDIGGRAIDLGRVLAREGAAAVRRGTAIGVDDDLAAGDARVAVGAADLEQAGRVDVDLVVASGSQPSGSTSANTPFT